MAELLEQEIKKVRPPIVVVMGHIDHGKSMILETIRKTAMLEKEAGGITQHIGAYEVEYKGKGITFIDTPGHEAFSKIRSRGANAADLAILVVAADEGVKPQTKEAIEIIQKNELPFVVALNKIDKPEAHPARVKQELAEAGVLVEGYGGQVPAVEVSAKEGIHMDELLEMILLMAELEHFVGNPEKPAEGVVIEAHRDPRRGITSTLLVRDGTLTKVMHVVIGRSVESLKILENFLGQPVEHIDCSSPAVVAGLSEMPVVGDLVKAFLSKAAAEVYADSLPPESAIMRSEEMSAAMSGEKLIFNIIVKADVAGSREALEDLFKKIQSDVVDIRIIKSEVGDINESDVKMAQATKLVTIVGFKVRVDPAVRELARGANTHIVTGDIIYDLLDQVKKEIEDMLPPEIRRNSVGRLKILKVFRKEGQRQIIGGRVEEGLIKKGVKVDIKRYQQLVGIGVVLQVQREKQEVADARAGTECGMLVESKTGIQEGDVFEIFEEEVIKRIL